MPQCSQALVLQLVRETLGTKASVPIIGRNGRSDFTALASVVSRWSRKGLPREVRTSLRFIIVAMLSWYSIAGGESRGTLPTYIKD